MPKLSPLGERVETGSFIADGRFSGWCIPGTSLSQIGTGEADKKGKVFNFKSVRLLTLIIDFSLQDGSGTVNEKC